MMSYNTTLHHSIQIFIRQAVRMCRGIRQVIEGTLDEYVASARVQVQYARVRGNNVLVKRECFRERPIVHEQVLVRPLKGDLLRQSAGAFNDHLSRAFNELDVQCLAHEAWYLRDN